MKQAVSIFDIITQSVKAKEEVPQSDEDWQVSVKGRKPDCQNWEVVDQTSASVTVSARWHVRVRLLQRAACGSSAVELMIDDDPTEFVANLNPKFELLWFGIKHMSCYI